jgi:predicted ribosome quality control (RQC) complex YloA/Tae2 family protein
MIDVTFEDNTIYIGRNQEENDLIISKAKQTDFWFHLADFPSCHVILSCDKKRPMNNKMIEYCAKLTKENTKHKYRKVKVIYTQMKNIRKTKVKGQVTIKGKVKTIVV